MENSNNEDLKIFIQPTTFEGEVIEAGFKKDLIPLTPKSLDEVFNLISIGAKSFSKALNKIDKKEYCPDSAILELGVQFGLKGKVFIAESSANSSLKIRLVWNSTENRK